MKVSGPIRRTERKTSRTVARRNSSPRFASPPGTAPPGPDAHHSGPGSLPLVGPLKPFLTAYKSVPSQPSLVSRVRVVAGRGPAGTGPFGSTPGKLCPVTTQAFDFPKTEFTLASNQEQFR